MNTALKSLFAGFLVIALSGCGEPPDATIAVGTLERDRAELRAPAMETVTRIHVDDGATVTKGQLLLQLDPRRIEARLAQARASLAAAEARLAEIRRGARSERIEQAQAGLAAARSQLEQARSEWRRLRKLAAEKLASESQLDAARTSVEIAESTVEERHAALAELLTGATPEELARVEAERDVAAARRDELQVVRAELDVQAPFAGRVEQLLVETGDRVPVGMTMATLLHPGPPYANMLLPAEVKQSLSVGDQRAVEVDGHGCYLATLRFVASEATFTPYYSLREEDRGRLVYRAELQLPDSASGLPTGIGVELRDRQSCETQ